jgi:hypothetical protein
MNQEVETSARRQAAEPRADDAPKSDRPPPINAGPAIVPPGVERLIRALAKIG